MQGLAATATPVTTRQRVAQLDTTTIELAATLTKLVDPAAPTTEDGQAFPWWLVPAALLTLEALVE